MTSGPSPYSLGQQKTETKSTIKTCHVNTVAIYGICQRLSVSNGGNSEECFLMLTSDKLSALDNMSMWVVNGDFKGCNEGGEGRQNRFHEQHNSSV